MTSNLEFHHNSFRYTGKSMRDAHQYLRLSNTEFDATVGHLV